MLDICIKCNKLCDHCSSIGCVLLKNNHLQSLFTDTYLWMCAITFAHIDNHFLTIQGDPIIALVNSMFDNADSYPSDGQLDPEELWDTLEIFDGDGKQHYSHVTHWNGNRHFDDTFLTDCTGSCHFDNSPVHPVAKISTKWHVRFSARASWRFKSPTTGLFVHQTVQYGTKENSKAPHHWPFVRIIHRWPRGRQGDYIIGVDALVTQRARTSTAMGHSFFNIPFFSRNINQQ